MHTSHIAIAAAAIRQLIHEVHLARTYCERGFQLETGLADVPDCNGQPYPYVDGLWTAWRHLHAAKLKEEGLVEGLLKRCESKAAFNDAWQAIQPCKSTVDVADAGLFKKLQDALIVAWNEPTAANLGELEGIGQRVEQLQCLEGLGGNLAVVPPPQDTGPDLDDQEIKILRALHRQRGKYLVNVEIEANNGPTRKTVARKMPRLVTLGLAKRSPQQSRGYAITTAGTTAIERFLPKKPTQ